MDKQIIEKALKEVARRNGVSVEEVRREIELATGGAQTAEETIAQLTQRVSEKRIPPPIGKRKS